jgi:hypothetical protein
MFNLGKKIAAAIASLALAIIPNNIQAFAASADGALEETFGVSGASSVNSFNPLSAPGDPKVSIAPMADGGLYLGAQVLSEDKVCNSAESCAKFRVIRLDSSGRVDEKFNIEPEQQTGVTSPSIATDSKGNVYVAFAGNGGFFSFADLVLARYKPNGKLDTKFAEEGYFNLNAPFEVSKVQIIVDDSGITTAMYTGYESNTWLTRILSDGTADNTFGFEGSVEIKNSKFIGSSMRVDDAGTVFVLMNKKVKTSKLEALVYSFSNLGFPSSSFGKNGVIHIDSTSKGGCPAFTGNRAGNILVACVETTSKEDKSQISIKLIENGILGKDSWNLPIFSVRNSPTGEPDIFSFQGDEQGKYILVSSTTQVAFSDDLFGINRLNETGTPDITFGSEGSSALTAESGQFESGSLIGAGTPTLDALGRIIVPIKSTVGGMLELVAITNHYVSPSAQPSASTQPSSEASPAADYNYELPLGVKIGETLVIAAAAFLLYRRVDRKA